jgi:hypothetical protein
LTAGTYTVTITDANGCIVTGNGTIVTMCCNVTSSGSITGTQSNCGSFDPSPITSVSLPSGGIGTMEYIWLKKLPGQSYTVISGATGTTYDPGVITQTTKYRRCARRNNCTTYAGESNWITMTVHGGVAVNIGSFSNVLCNGASNGSATVNATGNSPFNYIWSNGLTSVTNSGLAAGTYSVTVTDVNGCTANTQVTITEPNVLTTTVQTTQATCSGSLADGSMNTLVNGGTAPFTYVWSNGSTTSSVNGLTAGTYTVTITDANGCTVTGNGTIVTMCCNVTSSGSITGTQSNCGSFDPSPITSVSLPSGGVGTMEYIWLKKLPGQSYTVISGATGTTYDPGVITQTTKYRRCARRNNCTTYAGESNWITMTVNGGVNATVQTTQGTCAGNLANGSVNVVVTSGNAPYTYNWSNGSTSSTVNNLSPGTYTVTVTDANGCTVTKSSTVATMCCNVTSAGYITGAQSNCGSFDPSPITSVSLPSGGVGSLEYVWLKKLPGQTQTVIPGATGPTYDPGVVSQTTQYRRCARRSNCSRYIGESNWITISVTNGITVGVVYANNVQCKGAANGSIKVNAATGTGPFTYNWSNGSHAACIKNLSPGNYYVTITGAGGCYGTKKIKISSPSQLVVNTSAVDASCSVNPCGTSFKTIWAIDDTDSKMYYKDLTDPNSAIKIEGNVSGSNNKDLEAMTIDDNGVLWILNNKGNNTELYKVDDTQFDGNPNTPVTLVRVGDTRLGNNINIAGLQFVNGVLYGITEFTQKLYSLNTSTGRATFVTNLNLTGYWDRRSSFKPEALTQAADGTMYTTDTHGSNSEVWKFTSFPYGKLVHVYTMQGSGKVEALAVHPDGTLYAGDDDHWYQINLTTNSMSIVANLSTDIEGMDFFFECEQTQVNSCDGSANASVYGGVAPYTYAWSNGETTSSVNGLCVGNYSVTVTDANGCTKVSYTDVDCDDTDVDSNGRRSTSTGEEISARVYPNPSTGRFTIEFESASQEQVKVVLYDMAGNQVGILFDGMVDEYSTQYVSYNNTQLSPGVYTCIISSRQSVTSKKVIVR